MSALHRNPGTTRAVNPWTGGSSTPWLYKMSKKLSGSPGAMVRRKSVMVEFKPQPYTICWYWIWNYSTQMKTAWHMMNKMHISQQRKIKLFHRNVSTMPSMLNNNRRRHAKPIFTGKLTHFAKTKITMRGNKNNHLENSNFNKCNNRIKLKKHLSKYIKLIRDIKLSSQEQKIMVKNKTKQKQKSNLHWKQTKTDLWFTHFTIRHNEDIQHLNSGNLTHNYYVSCLSKPRKKEASGTGFLGKEWETGNLGGKHSVKSSQWSLFHFPQAPASTHTLRAT